MQSKTREAGSTKRAVTYREAAISLGLCERTVWGLVRDGQLKAAKIGRSVRIPVSEIDRFLSETVQVANS